MGLKELRVFSVGETLVTDEGVKYLTAFKNLTDLRLNDIKATDAGLIPLKSLDKLAVLSVNGTKLSANGLNEIQTALPKCKIFSSVQN